LYEKLLLKTNHSLFLKTKIKKKNAEVAKIKLGKKGPVIRDGIIKATKNKKKLLFIRVFIFIKTS
jgi:hypothetical protein